MRKFITHRRLQLTATILIALLPMSALAEPRPRTDLRELARELEKIFGSDSVEILPSSRPTPPARPVSETHVPAIVAASEFEQQALDAMNFERERKGLPPLQLSPALTAAAESKADHMLRNGYFDHVSPDGLAPAHFADHVGYRYSRLGENLAVGYTTGDGVVGGWMKSTGHRANILGNYTEVGIAAVEGSPMSRYRGDTWVAIYGTR